MTGFEPDTDKNADLLNNGQNKKNTRQNKSQLPVNVNDAKGVNVNLRTNSNDNLPNERQPENTTPAEREHNINITELLSDPNLEKIVNTWHSLPEAIKNGIIAMVETSIKTKS